jgi:hypothetical protein
LLTLHSNTDAILSQILNRVHSIQPGGAVYDTAMHAAIDTQLTSCVKRIHTDGQASDGSDIGQYSTTPMYVNPLKSPASFPPLGKTGRDTFIKSGKPHLTKYFDAGYRAYRQEIGLSADKVVLTLSGELRDGLMVMPAQGSYTIGWQDEELYKLAQMLESRYAKPIWAATTAERAEMVKAVSDRVSEALK